MVLNLFCFKNIFIVHYSQNLKIVQVLEFNPLINTVAIFYRLRTTRKKNK